ncbi:hypothetical protein [Conexibacter arvalis]|uniref:Uncharacterized protein n=1 Tax=Conexibacter arvalis TaxID=912552 RepID=A0A840IG03_9ACTN|nr:hypothetical protein [Conexibacter arvalis]MBB4663171.1 hypothetical protein [Conexibacter arvalis]
MPRQDTIQQIIATYGRLASEAHYRPMAPSDGLGNITVPEEELDLEAEATDYMQRWDDEEDNGRFYIGTCNFETRPATIFAVEAARMLCATEDDTALRLLRMAVAELEAQQDE